MSALLPRQLVTIIAERVLRSGIVDEIRSLGARGFTITDVAGEGTRGVHASDWEGANVKIETIVTADVAERIIEHVASTYFEHYAVIVYVHDISVVRGAKYS